MASLLPDFWRNSSPVWRITVDGNSMRKTLGYFIAFWVIFIFGQFYPASESAFVGYTHWDVLLFALVCARGSQFADVSVTGCAEITDFTVATALGEIVGEALAVGSILLIFYLLRRRFSRKNAKSEAKHFD